MTLQRADLQAVMKPGGCNACSLDAMEHLPTDSRMHLSIKTFLNLYFASDGLLHDYTDYLIEHNASIHVPIMIIMKKA